MDASYPLHMFECNLCHISTNSEWTNVSPNDYTYESVLPIWADAGISPLFKGEGGFLMLINVVWRGMFENIP